jgi:hypothetical protein
MRQIARGSLWVLIAIICSTATNAQVDKTTIGGTVMNSGTGKPEAGYLPKFTETKLGFVNHIQIRPNPLAN